MQLTKLRDSPYGDEDKRHYVDSVSIEPLPGAGKDFSPSTKQAAVDENAAVSGGTARCVYCRDKVSNQAGPDKVNVDHAQAKANNGNNTLPNAQVTCQYCNQSKGTSPAPKTSKPRPDQNPQ